MRPRPLKASNQIFWMSVCSGVTRARLSVHLDGAEVHGLLDDVMVVVEAQ